MSMTEQQRHTSALDNARMPGLGDGDKGIFGSARLIVLTSANWGNTDKINPAFAECCCRGRYCAMQ